MTEKPKTEVRKVKRTSLKKKKNWYTLIASKEYNEVEIGQTLSDDVRNLLGKNVEVNLKTLTGDPKKQNIRLVFKVKDISGDRLRTEVDSYSMSPSYVGRVIRKERNKLEDSFVGETKDKLKIRVKPLIMTKGKVTSSILKELRKRTKNMLESDIQKQSFNEFVYSVVTNKVQRLVKEQLKKVYPVALFEIRALKRINPKQY